MLYYFLQICATPNQNKGTSSLNDTTTSQYISPSYPISFDETFHAQAIKGSVDSDIYHRMVRGTITMMVTVAKQNGKDYLPIHEVDEMAKSLVIKYPSLSDKTDSRHVRLIL